MKNNRQLSKSLINLKTDELLEHALNRKEGILSKNGALCVTTGKRTGRSPKDRFIVKDKLTENYIHWGDVNRPISSIVFSKLWKKGNDYINNKTHFISDLYVGEDKNHRIPVRVITEKAWHCLFAEHMFIKSLDGDNKGKSWTLLNIPNLEIDPQKDKTNSDGVVIINFEERKIFIAGILYAGEIKKSMFSVMNYILPSENVLPMHCAANKRTSDNNISLFFGLSGTGKTTLSSDAGCSLIGDDEHGWGQNNVFNFEGGCYAKCINLKEKYEPIIWNAIRSGAIMENVVLSSDLSPDYENSQHTLNTRAAYPREFIENRIIENMGENPKFIFFLTCDLHGVLPPISILNKEQAAYFFLSGYTAAVGSTEVGSSDFIKETFSACFGAPFFPRNPTVYSDLLMKRINESGCKIFLINTGWIGGGYDSGGERISIQATRSIIKAATSNDVDYNQTEILPYLKLRIPKKLKGVEEKILNPRNLWKNKNVYDKKREELIKKFIRNFERFDVAENILQSGPSLK